MELHRLISKYFQLTDIRLLCAILLLDFENVKGENKDERIIDIISIFQANGRLHALQEYLEKERPHILWQPYFDNLPDYRTKKGSNAVPIQLPLRPKHFTGRESELEELRLYLYPGKKVTLWAAGGMGKTTIAAETVYRLQDEGELLNRFPDGVIFFSFYGRSQNEELYQHIIRTLAPTETEFTFETCFRCLSGKKLLLVYDGSEEAADLQQVVKLQGQNGLLITTRDRRSYGGERIEVGLLPMEKAKTLLMDWSAGNVNEKEAQAICEVIGRLPLAVRIAGFYLDESGEMAADYLEMLQETPIQELSQGESQYESVEILLKRTVAKLSEETQTVLALMGRLVLLPFGIEPLVAATDRRAVRGALNQLNRYGLILRENAQIQLTHALVHRYARRRLSLDSSHFIKLVQFYEKIARAESKKGPEGFQNLHAHRPHMMVVLMHCVTQKAWQVANSLVLVMTAEQGYLELQGFNQIRVQMSEIGVQAAREMGDSQSVGTHLTNLGLAYHFLGKLEQALAYYNQALRIQKEVGDRFGLAENLNNIGAAYYDLGQQEEALNYYNQSLPITEEIGDRVGVAVTLNNIGAVYNNLGQQEEALNYYNRSLPIREEVGDRAGLAVTLNNIGKAYNNLGQQKQALAYYNQALPIQEEVGYRASLAHTLTNIGLVYDNLGQREKALNTYNQALPITEEVGDRNVESIIRRSLAGIHREDGNLTEAAKEMSKAVSLAEMVQSPRLEQIREELAGIEAALAEQKNNKSEK